MRVVDLTPEYITQILGKNDLRAYGRSYPALFRHYFRFWAKRREFRRTLSRSEALRRSALVAKRLRKVEKMMQVFGFAVKTMDVVLFVGQDTSNGHAFKDEGRFVVWLPVETYGTALLADVFIAHEIVHALHYSRSPDFYFSSKPEQRLVSRQLITEGIATYLTMQVMKVNERIALWADYLPKQQLDDWFTECARRERELCQIAVANFHSSNRRIELFYANDPRDLAKFRSGYYLGLKMVQHAVATQGLTPSQLLSLPRRRFEELAREYLTARLSGC